MQRFTVTLLLVGLFSNFANALGEVDSAADGATVYAIHCAGCHEAGVGRAPSREALDAMSPDTIVQALESGAMRVLGQWDLNGPQRIAVAEYLSGKLYDPSWRDAATNRCDSPIKPSSDPFARPYWNGWAVDDSNTRFQPAEMAGISKADLAGLKLKWVFAFPGETVVEAQPAVVDGRVYTGSRSGTFYALDADSGCTYWTFQAEAPIKNAPRVEAIGEQGRLAVFFGDIAGWVYALDAVSGEIIWKIRSETHSAARIVGGIQFQDGALYIGVSSLEEALVMAPGYVCCTFRGSVMKVDAATGLMEWRSYVIEAVPTGQGKNKDGHELYGPSGAAIWSAVTLDNKLGRVYVSTGNNYSHPTTATSDGVLALSMATGKVLWTYQGLAGDARNSACDVEGSANCPDPVGEDYDMGSSPMLITLPSGQRLLAAGQKSGLLHVLDPDDNGKLLWKKRVSKGGFLGGIEWGSATDGKRFYVAKSDLTWHNDDFASAAIQLTPDTGGGTTAVDAETGKIVWEAPPVSCAGRKNCSPGQTAAVTAIPGVVFSGSISGVLRAFDSETGEVLWEYDTARSYDSVNGASARGGAIDGPGVVVADGQIYVTSGYAKFGGLPGNVLLVFAKSP